MRKIICALNCQFYEPFSIIIEKDKPVDAVHFIFNGWAQLTSVYVIEGEEFGFKMKLIERSWYGEYQVLLNAESTFNMQAGVNKSSDIPLVKIMSIDAVRFRRYADEYPTFRRFMLLRCSVRRAYTNFRLKMCAYESFLKNRLDESVPDFAQNNLF